MSDQSTPQPSAGAAAYVDYLGSNEQSFAGPVQFKDVLAYSFPLKVDREQLQKFVDKKLNVVSGGKVTHTVFPFVMNVFINAGYGASLSQTIGWTPWEEISFWVPMLQKKDGELMPRLIFWNPYLFMDNMSGMITGRELWGYRKMPGKTHVPKHPGTAAHFWVDALVFKTLAADTQGQVERLLEIEGDSVIDKFAGDWAHPEDAIKGIFGEVIEKLAAHGLTMLEAEVAKLLGPPNIPCVCLKQYRDAVDPTLACYQALTLSTGTLDKWQSGGLLHGNFTLTINTYESAQIVKDLGLIGNVEAQATTITPLFGCWVKMDFTCPNGEIIWGPSA